MGQETITLTRAELKKVKVLDKILKDRLNGES
jgi:hypothetical protein